LTGCAQYLYTPRAYEKYNIINRIKYNRRSALSSACGVTDRSWYYYYIPPAITRLLQYRYLAVSRRRGVPYTLLLLLLLSYTAFVRHGFYIIYFYFFTLLIMCIMSHRIDTFNMYDVFKYNIIWDYIYFLNSSP